MMLLLRQRVKNETEDNETTCDRPDNPYTTSSALARQPHGIRLDYIMYRANAGECQPTNIDAICMISDNFYYHFFNQPTFSELVQIRLGTKKLR